MHTLPIVASAQMQLATEIIALIASLVSLSASVLAVMAVRLNTPKASVATQRPIVSFTWKGCGLVLVLIGAPLLALVGIIAGDRSVVTLVCLVISSSVTIGLMFGIRNVPIWLRVINGVAALACVAFFAAKM